MYVIWRDLSVVTHKQFGPAVHTRDTYDTSLAQVCNEEMEIRGQ